MKKIKIFKATKEPDENMLIDPNNEVCRFYKIDNEEISAKIVYATVKFYVNDFTFKEDNFREDLIEVFKKHFNIGKKNIIIK